MKSYVSLLVFSLIVLIFWSLGCSSANKNTIRLIDSDQKMVAKCKFVGTVEGYGGSFSSHTEQEDASNKAAAMGATHIIWGSNTSTDHGSGTVSHSIQGKAYKCPPEKKAKQKDEHAEDSK
jgi:hypothetical protein